MNTATRKQQLEGNKDDTGNINIDTNNSSPSNNKKTEKLELPAQPVRHVAK